MDEANLYYEAKDCRQKASRYLGKPEAPFLLRVAREFERLAVERKRYGRGESTIEAQR